MSSPTKKSRITLDGERLGEVIDWSPTHPIEEEDTSIIDNDASNYAPRVSVDLGTPEITVNMYDDPTNTAQAAIELGTDGIEFVGYPVSPEVGMAVWTYHDCIVTGDDPGTIAYKGRLKRVVKLKANGGRTKSVVPAS